MNLQDRGSSRHLKHCSSSRNQEEVWETHPEWITKNESLCMKRKKGGLKLNQCDHQPNEFDNAGIGGRGTYRSRLRSQEKERELKSGIQLISLMVLLKRKHSVTRKAVSLGRSHCTHRRSSRQTIEFILPNEMLHHKCILRHPWHRGRDSFVMFEAL